MFFGSVAPETVRSIRWATIAGLAAVAAVQLVRHPVPLHELTRRLPRCVVGLVAFGFGIVLFIRAQLGTAPWDVFHAGLAKQVDLPVGLIINLVGVAVLPLWIPLRQRIGLGTVLNTLLIGITVDSTQRFVEVPTAMPTRVAFVVVAIVIIGAGSALYIGSGLGTGPRDGVMMGLHHLGLSVRTARTLIEAVTLAFGFLLGGVIGLGTIAFLVGIGPVVQALLPRLRLSPLASSEDR